MRGIEKVESVQPPIFVVHPDLVSPPISFEDISGLAVGEAVLIAAATITDPHKGRLMIEGLDSLGKTTFLGTFLQCIPQLNENPYETIFIGRSEAGVIMNNLGSTASLNEYLKNVASILNIAAEHLIVVTNDVAIAADLSDSNTEARIILEASPEQSMAVESLKNTSGTHTWSSWDSIRVDVIWENLGDLIKHVYAIQHDQILEDFDVEIERKHILKSIQKIASTCRHHFGSTSDRDSEVRMPASLVGSHLRAVAQFAAMEGTSLSDMSSEQYEQAFNFASDHNIRKIRQSHDAAEDGEDEDDPNRVVSLRVSDPSKQEAVLRTLQSSGVDALMRSPLAQYVTPVYANANASGEDETHAQEKSDLEFSKISTLGKRLKKSIIGQDDVIDAVVDALAIPAAGLHAPSKPLRTFLFMGPTGVGKTELSKQIAAEFATEKMNVIRLDMSEYATPGSATAMYGSTPGYIGYDPAGGALTREVAKNPNSLIILDEIEKAHESIWDAMLQVFDAGRMTTGSGNVVDFSNCVIVMTTNLGASEMSRNSLGFGDIGSAHSDVESAALSALSKYLKPEMINRIDDKIVFKKLDKLAARKIAKREIAVITERIESAGHSIASPSAGVLDQILTLSKFDIYGAREIQRSTQKYIATPVAKEILSAGKGKKNFSLVVADGTIVIIDSKSKA